MSPLGDLPPDRPEIGHDAGVGGSVRASLREVGYFLPYLRPDWHLAAGSAVLSVLSILSRFPLLFLPAILTAHFQVGDARAGSSASNPFGRMALEVLRGAFGTQGALTAAVVLAFAGILLLAPLQLVRSYWLGLVGEDLLRILRLEVFANLKRLNMLAVYERGAGPFVQRLTRDLSSLYGLFVSTLAGLIALVLHVAIYLTALLLLEPRLTLMVLVTYGLLQPILLRFNGRIQRQAARIQELHEGVTTQMLESIGGYRDILAAGYFDRMSGQFQARVERLRREDIRALMWSETCELLLNLVFGLLAIVPYYVALGRIDRIDQVGLMITYVGLQASLLPSLAGLWGSSIELAMATPSLRAVRELVTTTAAPHRDPALPGPTPRDVRRIRFDGVGLRLGDRWIVRDLTFEVAGGRLTALIGQSGSGKTTVFHLLLRLLTPTCGTIWIDDTPLADLDEADLRRLIGFIPQNPFIFNTSLRENLLVAATGAEDRADVLLEDVIEAAQLEGLVRSRRGEGGLDSGAGYLGMRLSGGERQRLALGRLLVQDPRVIVCDEYTANIDVQTAALIQDMMRTRFAGRTRLVITHELYNARGADAILVLDHGRIVQAGTHQELLASPGLYRSLWETQRLE